MTAILAFVLSPIGRWIAGVFVLLAIIASIYAKGRIDGHASEKAKVERQINDAVQKGDSGRANALKQLNNDSVPDGWFRD